MTELRVDGGGAMDVLGGRVVLESVSGSEIFSPYPSLEFSAAFSEIDLGRLTRRIDFGEMSGTMEGYVRDCLLFRGVPVRFEARMETVKRRGVGRSISVKAINNMAIIGTGQGTGNIFDRGIRRFLNRFTYKRVGIYMELENDVFLLRGLERRGDQELFIKGRLPLAINIVNAKPGKTVSFQSMLRRIDKLEIGEISTGRADADR